MSDRRLSRRAFLGGAVVLGTGLGIYAAGGRDLYYSAITPAVAGMELDAEAAYEKAKAGEITLVDIRRPEEWASTGSGDGAARIDMRRDDFIDALDAITGGARDAPVALICARGVRSARLNNQLIEAGFTNIIDVPEGMLGSRAGPGWINRGLPLDKS